MTDQPNIEREQAAQSRAEQIARDTTPRTPSGDEQRGMVSRG